MTAPATTTLFEPVLREALARLGEQLRRIGLGLWVYDVSGECVSKSTPNGEICDRFCATVGPAQGRCREMMRQVWADREERIETTAAGCVAGAMPVRYRRRVVAVALVCYVPTSAGASEEFALACDRLHLDRTYLTDQLTQLPTHPAEEAASWMKMVGVLLNQATANAVARSELASFSASMGTTYEELSLLYRLSGAMKVNATPVEFFEQVCAELLDVVNMQAAVSVLKDKPHSGQPGRIIRVGELGASDAQLLRLGRWIQSEYLNEASGQGVVVNEPPAAVRKLTGEINNFVAVPLVAGDMSMGLLVGVNNLDGAFDSTDQKLIHSVGAQVAVFFANNHLYDELQELLMGVLHVLTASIDAKDKYTRGHSQRVAMISRRLAEMCGFDQQQIENLYLAGLLHDIGKIGVPEDVLCKPGRLTNEEFERIKRHPVIGANILSNIRQMKPVLPGVLHHHERLDGRGYPDGLAGAEVPIEGRIVGLADCFDAMTSSRTYRQAMPLEHVVAEITRYSGTQFDPVLVDHLLSLDLSAFLAELRREEPALAAIGHTAGETDG